MRAMVPSLSVAVARKVTFASAPTYSVALGPGFTIATVGLLLAVLPPSAWVLVPHSAAPLLAQAINASLSASEGIALPTGGMSLDVYARRATRSALSFAPGLVAVPR